MRRLTDDCVKRRLTDRREIAIAVDYLRASGLADNMIAVALSRKFYVDIDELNAVLAQRAFRPPAAGREERLGAAA